MHRIHKRIRNVVVFGDPRRPITIVDTPGFDDPGKKKDAVIIAELVKTLNNEGKKLSLILFTLNGQSPRLEGSLKAMITLTRQMLSDLIWNNLAVVFTRMPKDKNSVQKRNKTKQKHDEYIGEKWVKEISLCQALRRKG